jgi:Icc protein
MLILQITDPHLYGDANGNLRGVQTDTSLRHVIEDAWTLPHDYSALVQDDPAGYLRFKSILGQLQKPVLCVPGNHDEPDAMRASLSDAPFQYCGTRRLGEWQLILLDSYDPGHVGGRLTEGELSRLDAALAQVPAHALLCHVRGILWGHVHQVYEAERNGVRLFATPSTGAQFLPHSDRYAVDSRPPAYRTLDLQADGRIESEVRWVESSSGRLRAAG